METIYFLTNEQVAALTVCNTQSATFVACWYIQGGIEGVAIEQSTLDNPLYATHKAVFDAFIPQPEPVAYNFEQLNI